VGSDVQELDDRWAGAVGEFIGADPGRSVLVSGRGRTVAVAADVERPGASVNKLFVAIALVLAGSDGDVDPRATIAVDELAPTRYPTITSAFAPGHRLSLTELAALMLATSDNRIADHLVRLLGHERITALARSLGCCETTVAAGFADAELGAPGRANVTSARDCATALAVIAADPRCDPLRPALRSSLFNTRILAALPDEIVVSHKTGTLAGVVNDVGIVHAPGGDLTLCFLADHQADPAGTAADIATCARAVLDAATDVDLANGAAALAR